LKADIAIIVPVLNEAAVLPALIRRLQAIPGIQAVFVDGGSTDGSRQLLEEAGVRWMATAPGRARQMNAGARASRSDILMFLHADTVLEPRHVDAARRAMADAAVAGGRFDIRLSGPHPAFRLIERMINLRSRLSRISTGDQVMFVRRDVFDRLGGFPEQPLMEDVAFSRRLKREGKIACLGERVVTSSRRWQEHGILRTVLLMWWLRLRYWLGADPAALKKNYGDHG